jgi:predicted transposase/invertase (TIGR01784 family)
MRHDADNGLLHNAVQAMFVELTKLKEVVRKPVGLMTGLEKFSVFLKYAANPDYRGVVNSVIESEEGLAVAGELLISISKDERERAIFRNRRIALADYESNMITAERIGRNRGMAESMLAVARNALQKGLSIEDIVGITGLTHAEVEALRNAG